MAEVQLKNIADRSNARVWGRLEEKALLDMNIDIRRVADWKKILDLLADFEALPQENRSFQINFFESISKPVDIYGFLDVMRDTPSGQLARAVENLLENLRKGQLNVSRRDLFRDVETQMADGALDSLKQAGLVADQPAPAAPETPPLQVGYRGSIFPPGLTIEQINGLEKDYLDVQAESMRLASKITSSPASHIVLGKTMNLGGLRYMLVTATGTEKTDFKVVSHSPLVRLEGEIWAQYGDFTQRPSSECAAFWHLFESLQAGGSAKMKHEDPSHMGELLAERAASRMHHVAHAHSALAVRAAADSDVVKAGPVRVPVIDRAGLSYGSRELGLKMAGAIVEEMKKGDPEKVVGIIVRDHGPFILGTGFKEAADGLIALDLGLATD